MRHLPCPSLTSGVAIVGAGLIAVAPGTPPAPGIQTRAVMLTGVDTPDSPLGGGVALFLGPSGVPTPSQSYMEDFDKLYLEPRGFHGTLQALTYPATISFNSPSGPSLDQSEAIGEQALVSAVDKQLATGDVDAANPIVVAGYSQGAVVAGLAQSELAAQGVPSDDLHFVLIGNSGNPDGGFLERFNFGDTHPDIDGITMTGADPGGDFYPTDIYTLEYDFWADFPQYLAGAPSDVNALLGMYLEHEAYLGLSPQQIHDAVLLPTSSADHLTNYYMIPQNMPLLEVLQTAPVVGNPLVDLVNPDASGVVNTVGYGNFAAGVSPGDVDVPTQGGLLPPLSTTIGLLGQLPGNLVNGAGQGVTGAISDVNNPDNYRTSLQSIENTPWLLHLLRAADAVYGAPDTTSTQELLDEFVNLLLAFNPHPAAGASTFSGPADDLVNLVMAIDSNQSGSLQDLVSDMLGLPNGEANSDSIVSLPSVTDPVSNLVGTFTSTTGTALNDTVGHIADTVGSDTAVGIVSSDLHNTVSDLLGGLGSLF